MRSFLPHPLPEQETDDAVVSNEQNAEDRSNEVPEGLISAADLPSAADALEELFREDAPPPIIPPEKPSIRELLFEEDAATEAAAAGLPSTPAAENAAKPDASKELAPRESTAPAQTEKKAVPESTVSADKGSEAPAEIPVSIAAESVSADANSRACDDSAYEPALESLQEVTQTTPSVTVDATAIPTAPEATTAFQSTDDSTGASTLQCHSPLPETVSATKSESASSVIAANTGALAEPEAPAQKLLDLLDREPSLETSVAPETAVAPPALPMATSDWALEERLACHKEWVESRGQSGSKANLAGAELEGAELIGVNLRYSDIQDSNLKSADLLLADLRDSCLVRTDLQESCLVGANLEGANLEGATLDTAMGLVPRQLAGANLHEASVPEQIAQFEARPEFARTSQMAARFFTATMAISAISSLMIWKTRDLQLLSDSCIIPFLHSPTAAAALPTAQIYLIAPVVLFIVYLVFHFHLQNLWDAVLQLPGIFPDGRELGQDGPRIVTGLLRAQFRWMNRDAASTRTVERAVALLLAYWVAPLTLLLFWGRYLTLQDLHGTMLHLLLVVVASGVALYSTTKVGRPPESWPLETKPKLHWLSRLRELNPLKVAAAFGIVLLLLALGTTKGAPHDQSRAPQFGESSIRRWAPTVFWYLGYDPYANLTEAAISTRPAGWSGSDDQISSVRGAKLNNVSFRYAQAYGVFLVNAHLWQSDFQGSFLADADLRGSDLGQSTLRYAIMDGARLFRANLDRANLDGTNLDRADFREANLSHCSLINAVLIDAQLQGATLYGARLVGSSMQRSNLEKTDLRSAFLDSVNLEHADLRQTYLWSARLTGVDLRNSQLASAIFIDADMRDSDLRGSQVFGTVLNGTNLTGSNIDGVDLRAALGLSAAQVCSTKSRNGAILTDSLAAQVRDACGGPLLAAPTPVAAPTASTTAGASTTAKTSAAHTQSAASAKKPQP